MKTLPILLASTLLIAACKEKPATETVQKTDSTIQKPVVVAIDSSLLIFPLNFRGLKLEGSLAEAKKKFGKLLKKEILQTGEGDFDIYRLYDEKGNPLAFFIPTENKPPLIDNITITSEAAQTPDGLKVGKTLGDLLAVYPKLTVSGSEIEGWTHAQAGGYLFKLDTNFWEGNIEIKRLNKKTKITEVLLNGLQEIREKEEN
jgi:hypothetical protein